MPRIYFVQASKSGIYQISQSTLMLSTLGSYRILPSKLRNFSRYAYRKRYSNQRWAPRSFLLERKIPHRSLFKQATKVLPSCSSLSPIPTVCHRAHYILSNFVYIYARRAWFDDLRTIVSHARRRYDAALPHNSQN